MSSPGSVVQLFPNEVMVKRETGFNPMPDVAGKRVIETRLHRTVLLGSDYYAWENPEARSPFMGPARPGIGKDSRVECAIIDRNASVGKNCVITNEAGVQEGEGPGFYIRDGIVVVVKNAEIPDGTVI